MHFAHAGPGKRRRVAAMFFTLGLNIAQGLAAGERPERVMRMKKFTQPGLLEGGFLVGRSHQHNRQRHIQLLRAG